MRRRARWAVMTIAVTILGATVAGFAADPAGEAPAEGDIESGRASFLVYCGGCHGEDGRGAGPSAAALETAPPDLTLLAARNDGTFPEQRVHDLIDGRATTEAHASREMPVWGLDLRQLDSDRDQEREVREKIRQIVVYLRSIQRPTD